MVGPDRQGLDSKPFKKHRRRVCGKLTIAEVAACGEALRETIYTSKGICSCLLATEAGKDPL